MGDEPAVVERRGEEEVAERLVDQVREDAGDEAGRDQPAIAGDSGQGEADGGPDEEVAEDEHARSGVGLEQPGVDRDGLLEGLDRDALVDRVDPGELPGAVH